MNNQRYLILFFIKLLDMDYNKQKFLKKKEQVYKI